MSSDNAYPSISREQRKRIIDRTNWVCVAVDAISFVIKLVVGVMVKSPALIADAMHSLSDLAADVPIILLAKVSHQDADNDHPYGHGRFETVGTVMLGAILLAVATGIAIENVQLLFSETRPTPSLYALATIVVALILKEGLFHYAIHQSRRARSSLLKANAWHARSDSLSSLVVLIGIVATLLGYPTVEILAALAVAALIGHMGVRLAWDAIQELVDRGVETDRQQEFIDTIAAVPGVKDVHMLRSRMMGNDVLIDAHIQVAGYLSVSEGHQINEWALKCLKERFDDVSDVTLHIDHEDDLSDNGERPLAPLRPTIESLLREYGIHGYDRLIIHYRNQQAELELRFADTRERKANAPACEALVRQTPWVRQVVLTEAGEYIH